MSGNQKGPIYDTRKGIKDQSMNNFLRKVGKLTKLQICRTMMITTPTPLAYSRLLSIASVTTPLSAVTIEGKSRDGSLQVKSTVVIIWLPAAHIARPTSGRIFQWPLAAWSRVTRNTANPAMHKAYAGYASHRCASGRGAEEPAFVLRLRNRSSIGPLINSPITPLYEASQLYFGVRR